MEGVCFVGKLSEEIGERRERLYQAGFDLGVKVVMKTSIGSHVDCKVTYGVLFCFVQSLFTQLDIALMISFTVVRAEAP